MTPRLAASCALTSRNADSSCSLLSTEGPIGDSSAISGGLEEERRREAKPGFGLGGASCEALDPLLLIEKDRKPSRVEVEARGRFGGRTAVEEELVGNQYLDCFGPQGGGV